MTVESNITKIIYQGNGLATEFPVNFAYSKTDDLHLLLTDESGVETEITSNFNVVVNGSGDTSVTYPVTGTPLPAGQRLTIYRDTPRTQIVDLINGGAFNPDVLEYDGFDRLEMQIQEIQEQADRAIKVAISGDKKPSDLLSEVFTARDQAVQSANNSAESEINAATSANNAAMSAQQAADTVSGAIDGINSAAQTGITNINNTTGQSIDSINAATQTGVNTVNSTTQSSITRITTATDQGVDNLQTVGDGIAENLQTYVTQAQTAATNSANSATSAASDAEESASILEEIKATQGAATYLTSYNFGDPSAISNWQQTLTNYALQQVSSWTEPANSTFVTNLWNSHEWVYSTETKLWIDYGSGYVQQATNDALGIVKGDVTTAGKVNVQPDGSLLVNGFSDILAAGIATQTYTAISDCNDLTRVTGIYYANVNTLNIPVSANCFIFHIAYKTGTSTYIEQIAYRFNSGKTYTRNYIPSAWSAWYESELPLTYLSGTTPAITDLNNITTDGWYFVNTASVANKPSQLSCYLQHIAYNSLYGTQIAYNATGSDSYRRYLSNGTWSDWYNIGSSWGTAPTVISDCNITGLPNGLYYVKESTPNAPNSATYFMMYLRNNNTITQLVYPGNPINANWERKYFNNAWTAWKSSGGNFAPKPQTAAGIGQWILISNGGGDNASILLPTGGTWAYCIQYQTGILAGGSVITIEPDLTESKPISGFAWRIS